MKKINYYLYTLPLIIMMTLAGCDDDDPGPGPGPGPGPRPGETVYTLKVTPDTDQTIGHAGGNFTFKVNTNSVKWDAVVSDQDQFSLLKLTGEFRLTALKNTTQEVIKATITVTADEVEDPVIIAIEQEFEPITPVFEVSPRSNNFNYLGGELNFFVEATYGWDATLDDESHFKILKRSNYFAITAPRNEEDKKYEATVTVTSEGFDPIEITVLQTGMAAVQGFEGFYTVSFISHWSGAGSNSNLRWEVETDDKGPYFSTSIGNSPIVFIRYGYGEDLFSLDFDMYMDLAGIFKGVFWPIIFLDPVEWDEDGEPLENRHILDITDPQFAGLDYDQETRTISSREIYYTHDDGKEYEVWYSFFMLNAAGEIDAESVCYKEIKYTKTEDFN